VILSAPWPWSMPRMIQPSNRLAEAFQSHPLVIRRINALRDYART
jgi:Zn-dependent protease with chaperone function